jgi:hypothetical protein
MHSLDLQQSSDVIREGILGTKPFMAGRFGLTEGALLWYTGVRGRPPSGDIRYRLSWGVGLFPVTPDTIAVFIKEQTTSAMNADAMLVWNKYGWEKELLAKTTRPKTSFLKKRSMSAVFMVDSPWTSALAGKRVIVVHPFAETIINQHRLIEELGILPDFELTVLQTPITVGPQKSGSWKDYLNTLKVKVSEYQFDVALIACGGYGMPLAGHIKKHGGKAVVVGGALQLFFGIKGKRWDKGSLYNEHWVRPAEHERPRGYKKIEGGCYW